MVNHRESQLTEITQLLFRSDTEIALSKFCGEEDVITPIAEKDEELRNILGYRGAQNYKRKGWYLFRKKRRKLFYNHMPSYQVKEIISKDIWRDYKKITIYRNPFDAIISRFYYSGGEKTGESFEEFVLNNPKALLENRKIAPLSGPSQLDFYIPYDRMKSELANCGLSFLGDEIANIDAKGSHRPQKGASMEEIYSKFPHLVEYISEKCAEEIAYFNFEVPGHTIK